MRQPKAANENHQIDRMTTAQFWGWMVGAGAINAALATLWFLASRR